MDKKKQKKKREKSGPNKKTWKKIVRVVRFNSQGRER